MVRRVFSNSRGYVHIVEETPAQAPAINDGGIGSLGCSPGFGESFLLTVSYANSCRKKLNVLRCIETYHLRLHYIKILKYGFPTKH